MSRDINPYALRLPAPLKVVLKDLAYNSRRSLNAEIVTRLVQSLKQDGVTWQSDEIKQEPQIYTVQPSKINKDLSAFKHKKKGVDYLTLTVAIEAGEKSIESEHKEYNARKKALLFSLLYDSIDEEEPSLDSVDQKTIKMLIELAG